MVLPVTSTARISSVCSSRPMWVLRQRRRLPPPCLPAFHSPSPSALNDSAVCPCCPPASAADLLSPDRPWAALGGNGNRQGLLPSTQPAVVSNVAIEIDQLQQAFHQPSHQPGRLSQRQAKQHSYRQTGLDCSIAIMWAITWLAATFARGPGSPIRLAIKPDRKGAALLQAMMINRPVPGLPCRRGPTAHSKPRP